MRNELAQLHKENQRTTLYVTHDQVEAMTLGQRICVMNEGEIIQVGSPSEIYNQPVHQFVAEFFGSPAINLLTGEVSGSDENGKSFLLDELSIAIPSSAQPGQETVVLGIRPENLMILEETDSGKTWETKIERIEDLGDSRLIHLSLGGQNLIVRSESRDLKVGMPLFVRPDWERAHWFDPSSGNRL